MTSVESAASEARSPAHGAPRSLKERILNAGSWTMFSHLFGHVLRMASSLFMTRLLVPEMFGVMALATVVQVVISLLSDIGLRQAVIHSPRGNSPEMLNTAWTMQVIRGWFIWGVCALVAAALWAAGQANWLPSGSVYAAVDLPAVIAVSALSAVFMGFQSTKAITVNRDLDLKRFTYIEIIAQLLALVVMAALALWTRSIWSMVFGGLFAAALTTLLTHTWLPGSSNRFQWHAESAKEIVGYGKWVLLSSILFVLASNGDRLLLGAWVDATTLGLYSLALNLALVIDGAGGKLFASVAMPALSEVARETPERFRAVYFRMRLPFDLAFVGCAGLLFAAGQLIVDILYDPRYQAAGHILQLLSFSLVFARFGLAGSAYLALGAPRALMWIHVVKLLSVAILVPTIYAFFGLDGAFLAIALHLLPTLPLMYYFNRRHNLNDARFELLTLAAWPVGYAFGWAVVQAMRPLLGHA